MATIPRTKLDPKQHSRSGESAHEPAHEPAAGEGEQTPSPFAAVTGSPILSNFSIAPSTYWVEFTNTAAFALTVGANTITANLPISGAGWLLQFVDKLLLAAVVPATPFVPEEGLPVPQSAKKLTNDTALPAAAGIRNVSLNTTVTPPTVTIHVFAQTAGTVAAGSRWMIFSVQGV